MSQIFQSLKPTIKSIQVVSVTGNSDTNVDTTISSVNPARCVLTSLGALNTNSPTGIVATYGLLTSATNLRIQCYGGAGQTFSINVQITEYN